MQFVRVLTSLPRAPISNAAALPIENLSASEWLLRSVMPEVAFHTGLPDKIGYTCRLLRKANRQGLRVRVIGSEPELELLDKALWTFDAPGPHHGHAVGNRLDNANVVRGDAQWALRDFRSAAQRVADQRSRQRRQHADELHRRHS